MLGSSLISSQVVSLWPSAKLQVQLLRGRLANEVPKDTTQDTKSCHFDLRDFTAFSHLLDLRELETKKRRALAKLFRLGRFAFEWLPNLLPLIAGCQGPP